MKIILTNDFHHTEVTLYTDDSMTLTDRQVAKARRTLCGVSGCTCGGDLGERGPQDWEIADIDTRPAHVRRWRVRVQPVR